MSRLQKTHEVLITASRRSCISVVETERVRGGGRNGDVREEEQGKKGNGESRWENLINAAGVSRCSPPTRAGRIDPLPPTCLPSTGRWGIPITVAALLAVDMDLTQRTHGRLLAALSFNNRYLSPSSSSPSISYVSRVCVCLFWPFHLPVFFFSFSLSFFHMLSPSSVAHFRRPYLIFSGFFCFRGFFSSLLPAWLSHPYSISPSSSSFHLSITASARLIRSKRFYKAQ